MMWMMFIPALFLAALVVGGILLVRKLWGDTSASPSQALGILEERYAGGEIDRDEFDERRSRLRA